jgi:hypothetical protein
VSPEVAEFVLARIAEAEADANAVEGDKSWGVDPVNASFAQVVSSDGAVAGGVQTPDAVHIARWDPARVLVQCAIHRAIVEEWQERAAQVDGQGRPMHMSDPVVSMMLRYSYQRILMLAMAHTDHPDYRREWHIPILTAEQRAAQLAALQGARDRLLQAPPNWRRLGLSDVT